MAKKRRGDHRSSVRETSTLPPTQERVRLADLEESAVFGGLEDDPRSVRFGVPEATERLREIARRSAVRLPPPLARQPRRGFRPLSVQDIAWRSLRIRAPAKVVFCVRRKERREVLFAKQRAGFRGSAKKRFWRRSQNSQYRC